MKKFIERLIRQTTVLVLWLNWKYSPKLVVVHGKEGRQYTEVLDDPSRRPMHCLTCGWFGPYKETFKDEYCPHCSTEYALPIDMLCESTSLRRFLKFASLEP